MPNLNWDNANKQQAFHEWKEFMESFFVINRVTDDKKYHYILISAGTRGRDLFQTAKLTEEDKKNPSKLWKIFEDFLVEKPNKWVQRIELQSLCQESDETIESFILRLRNKTSKCSFSDEETENDRILEQLIKGCRHHEERKRLLEKGEALDLKTAIIILKSHEISMKHVSQYSSAATTSERSTAMDVIQTQKFKCQKCGLLHEPRKCPAYGTQCSRCHKQNHWAKMCQSKPDNPKPMSGRANEKKETRSRRYERPEQAYRNKKLHNLNAESSSDEMEFNIDMLSAGKNEDREEIFTRIPIKVPGKDKVMNLKVKVDTGANANIITLRAMEQIYPERFENRGGDKNDQCSREKKFQNILSPSSTNLTAYGGTPIQQYGTFEVECKGKKITFFVVETNSANILGLQASQVLGLVKLNCAIETDETGKTLTVEKLTRDYPECFDTIGTFEKDFHITLKENAVPVIHAPRKCPIHIKDELFEVLQGMVEDKVIEKVNEPTDWVNSLAYSRKSNGQLRVCLDPRDLNKAIKREHHRTPTLDDISHKFTGAKVFSKLDAQHGYWAIKLDEESSLLTTFNSPFGRYKFLRLPFGLSVSQDIFQKRMDQILEHCPGVEGITDDVCVLGKTVEEHNKNLINLMEVAKKHGLVFNSKKCFIAQEKITFFGLEWSSDGVQPDPAKCDNIKSKASPENKSDLQTFLGMIQYMSPFIPNLSERTTALRELLKKGVVWQWCESHERIYQQLKDDIHHQLKLSYFDPSKNTVLEVDSSLNGLGAALLQEGKPVAFASKSLSDTEKRYANIEREMLAVVFACERFHTYIYGRTVTIQSDHKPLESIQLKNIAKAPPRLQRMLLKIQQYNVLIQYKAGKQMAFADFLSRNKPTHGDEIELDATIHSVMVSKTRKLELQEETIKDEELSSLLTLVMNGWPNDVEDVPKKMRPYWSMRDLLSSEDGLILKGQAIMIPKSLQHMILNKLHMSHQGEEKCLLAAKDSVFWMGMTKDIATKVKSCETCSKYARSQTRQPLLQPELPQRPFEKLAADIFHLDGQDFLLIADYYSKMPFVKTLPNLTSQQVIKYMESVFAIHGIPECLMTDNAKQFTSSEFREFTGSWEIEHITSSPYFPQSNGFIERMVQSVKSCLKKSKDAGQNPQLSLLQMRTTPIDNTLPSPSELLFNRKVRSLIPKTSQDVQNDEVLNNLRRRQKQQKESHDKVSTNLKALTPHQPVYVQDPIGKTWSPATVVENDKNPRSYWVETPDGAIVRRNRIHLRERCTEATAPPEREPADQAMPITMPSHNSTTTAPISNSVPVVTDVTDTSSPPETDSTRENNPYCTRSGRQIKCPRRFLEQYY